MKVLSLFDGISCGMVALERAGIPVERYVAYEIDQNAIKISRKNYPQIEHCGDVTVADFTQYRGFDLVIGGSPCQGFSYAGKMLNFQDKRSKLFFEYVRALKEAQPKHFLLENVKMKTEWVEIISEQLGVKPIEINSATVSAQNRVRLYWTNIPGVTQPDDRGIKLDGILESGEYTHPGAIRGRYLNGAKQTVQCLEVRAKYPDKSNCITTVDKDNVLTPLPAGRYENVFEKTLPYRYFTTKEYAGCKRCRTTMSMVCHKRKHGKPLATAGLWM